MVDTPTEKQLALLKKRNYTGPAPSTKREASDIIGKLLEASGGLAKEKQQTVFSSGTMQEVKWEKPTSETLDKFTELLGFEQEVESIAYSITKSLHPEMGENTQTFGMIVSSKEDKIIQLLLTKELRNIASVLRDISNNGNTE